MTAPWVSACPASVTQKISLVKTDDSFTVTAQTDKTRFIVHRKKDRFTVTLGPQHHCSCKRAQPCVHVLAALMLQCKVPPDNPVLWQRGISALILQETVKKAESPVRQCCLCRESMMESNGCVNCGELYHLKCLQLKAQCMHESEMSCPRCKVKVTVRPLAEKPKCTHCRSNCDGVTYRCAFCDDVLICTSCFLSKSVHASHPLLKVDVVHNEKTQGLFERNTDFQERELNPEDYHALLSLDGEKKYPTLSPEQFEQLNKLVISTDNHLNTCCMICLHTFREKETAVSFPCGHLFHEGCGRRWAVDNKAECPIDHMPCKP